MFVLFEKPLKMKALLCHNAPYRKPMQFAIFQGLRVESNPSLGVRILAGGKNLVLQGIQRHHSGNYTCTAFNVEGEDTSNPVKITVMCKFFYPIFFVAI